VLAVRRVAVSVVGNLRDARARELLLAQIERDSGTRAEAILAVAHMGDGTAAPHLVEIFDREPEPVRLAIIEALAELRQPIAEPLLAGLLFDPSAPIRRAAVSALLRFSTVTAVRHVVSVARDADWQVRAALAEHLPISPLTVPTIERLCMDANRQISETARARLDALAHAPT
jgi:HEAT repeat protein